ncbi:N-6 DNA methylase, partial [Escherichia coli]|uniref:N-6 DNA methylase n=2 Tax=Bacteria TaxID=2 RepID=UPI003CF98CE9
YKDVEKYARVVSLEEIRSNDYNLNITRYIDKSEEEEEVNLEEVIKGITGLENNRSETKAKLNGYLRELGLGEM